MLVEEVKKYFSLVKFVHSIFALPFAIIGYALGVKETGTFDIMIFIEVILAMVFARSAAMAFNRYIDRDVDKLNERTKNREIPAGKIKARNALIFTIVNSVLFIVVTAFINKLVFLLAPIALFVILFYSYTKRFTALSHFILGLGLSLAPIGAYLCVVPRFDFVPVLLSIMVLFWVSGFDIIYALQDELFDKEVGLKSIPAVLGTERSIVLSIFLHAIVVAIAMYIGFYNHYGIWYWIGAVGFIFFIIFQHSIVNKRDLSKINLAFFTANGIASIFYMIFFLLELWLD
jgi:4-hydroxybenzoate polyprenyltransferase